MLIEVIRCFFILFFNFNFIEEKKDEPRNAMEKAVFVDNLGCFHCFVSSKQMPS